MTGAPQRGRKKRGKPKRVLVECQDCGGNGEHEETCEECGEWLTEANLDWPEHGMYCKACVKKLDEESP